MFIKHFLLVIWLPHYITLLVECDMNNFYDSYISTFLIRTSVIEFKSHSNLVWPHFNLNTFAKTLFTNKVAFWRPMQVRICRIKFNPLPLNSEMYSFRDGHRVYQSFRRIYYNLFKHQRVWHKEEKDIRIACVVPLCIIPKIVKKD